MNIEDKYLNERSPERGFGKGFGKNNRDQIDLAEQPIETRINLDITMPACCASCMKAKPGTQWQCINKKILQYFGSKIIYTRPDLLCKYYVG